MLGVIFKKAQNKIQDPAKLKRLIYLIDEEVWMGLDIDVKGDIYEGLLQKNAEDIKSVNESFPLFPLGVSMQCTAVHLPFFVIRCFSFTRNSYCSKNDS